MSDTSNETSSEMLRPIGQSDLAETLGLFEPGNLPATVAFVGAGGKTSAMYAIAERVACGADIHAAFGMTSCRVVVTTTTHIRDPRLEDERRKKLFGHVIFESELDDGLPFCEANPIVVASRLLPDEGKLVGIDKEKAPVFAGLCDLLLVEADGSKGRPVKAPAEHEPVVPPNATIVVGVIGLDCLGRALGPDVAHRPERFGALVGCAQGQKIEPQHLVRLVRSAQGLFKGSPESSRRVVLLNKADLAPRCTLDSLLELLAAQPQIDDGEDFSVLVSCLIDGGMPKRERDSDTDRKGSQ
ncbi:MAG TPA: selenium cofactor biosynthesis protein YqeC [Spirochaetales bacterium]|nr:selenium cofactor biosynthesis protein YqeC [Spirochaetales bacterium]